MSRIPQKLMVIVNPIAGEGKALDLLPELEKLITELGARPDIRIPESPRESMETAHAASKCGYERIIAVGGDGTVNLVAGGIIGSQSVLGVIPAGTGNDFARMLGLPKDLKLIAKIAVSSDPVSTDVGIINNRPFFNMLGIGFNALVAQYARINKHSQGLASYLIAVYKTLKEYPPNNIRLRIDSYEVEQDALLVAVGIGRSTGSGFKLTPQAVFDDGKFDVCLVNYAKPLRILSLLPMAIRGRHVRQPEVSIYRCRQLEVFSGRPLPVHCEGETMTSENGKISIKMSREKLQVASGVKHNK